MLEVLSRPYRDTWSHKCHKNHFLFDTILYDDIVNAVNYTGRKGEKKVDETGTHLKPIHTFMSDSIISLLRLERERGRGKSNSNWSCYQGCHIRNCQNGTLETKNHAPTEMASKVAKCHP